MTIKKYSTIVAAIGALVIMTVSCEENTTLQTRVNSAASQQGKSITNTRITNYSFNGTEGDPITLEVATSWIANYRSKNPTGVAHFFGRETFNKILAKTGCIGIRIYYAIDDLSISSLILIGANGNGDNLVPASGIKGRPSTFDLRSTLISTDALSATAEDSVSADDSQRWLASYYTSNPTHIQAHFFGYEILRQILSENDCIGMRIYYALNDVGVPQLLLVGVDSNGKNLLPQAATAGRVADGGNTVADASFPCPSYCPGN